MRFWGNVDGVGLYRRQALASFFFALALLFPLSSQAQHALKGVALIIGNGDYAHLPRSPTPTTTRVRSRNCSTPLASTRRDGRSRCEAAEARPGSFVEDAEGADVAVLYYAGHGIEAGGENYLVPVDADLTALDAAADRLVPLSAFIDRLKATVPVTIVLLDACRNNPFPAGALVRIEPGGRSSRHCGRAWSGSRGAAPLSDGGEPGGEQLGTVIGFAAEPGRAALDGAPGQNSPYAAAVLKHLSAIGGDEFGTVMRMVAEEVYLKTAGRQRPWVNESLRRLLYFGKAAGTRRRGRRNTDRASPASVDHRRAARPRPQASRDGRCGRRRADGRALWHAQGAGPGRAQGPCELDKMLRSQTEA